MSKEIQHKGIGRPLEHKETREDGVMRIKAYALAFDNVDSYGDVILPTACDAFLASAGSGVATFSIPGAGDVRVAVVSGLGNTRQLMQAIDDGSVDYDFVEVMACPGGCVNGGGQPIQPASVRNVFDIKAMRATALSAQDAGMTLRKSHESPVVKELYADYLGEPGSHKAHDLLHCTYVPQKRYRIYLFITSGGRDLL